jgi:hypothetical protein
MPRKHPPFRIAAPRCAFPRRAGLVKAVLVLSAVLVLAGCAAPNDSSEQRHAGFYAGVSGGWARP